MKKIYHLFTQRIALVLAMMFTVGMLSAQCPVGQTNVDITYTTGGFNGENGWALFDATAGVVLACASTGGAGPAAGVTSVCVTDNNTIQLVGFETFGDGWCPPAAIQVDINETGAANGCSSPAGGLAGVPQTLFGPTASMASGTGAYTCVVGGPLPANGTAIDLEFSTFCPGCEILCPDDIIVGNAFGQCASAPIMLQDPTFNPPGCNIETPIDFVDITTTVQQNFNAAGLICTDFSLTLPPLPICIPEFLDIEVCVEGDFGFATESPNVNLGTCAAPGATVGVIPGGTNGDCGPETCITFQVMSAGFMAGGPLNMHLDTDADVDLFCAVNTITATTTIPTACGIFEALLEDGSPLPTDGVFPVGCTRVVLNSTGSGTGSGGDPISCSFDIIVLDEEVPIINAPGNFTFNLQGGECCQLYDFEVSGSDNCSLPPNGIDNLVVGPFCDPCNQPFNPLALACGLNADNDITQIITGLNAGDFITEVCFTQATFDLPNNGMFTVNLYCYDGVTVPSSLAMIGTPYSSTTVAFDPANNGNKVCVPISPIAIPIGCAGVAVEISTLAGRIVGTNAACIDGTAATGESTFITAPACGLATPGSMAGIGFMLDAPMSVVTQGATLPNPAIPPAGLFPADATVNAFEPGSVNLPIGTHCFYYELIDGAAFVMDCDGNVAPGAAANRTTASWCVTVNDAVNTVTSLTCNDDLNISIDEFCEVFISADMFLEGGPYSCFFDCYEVYIMDEHGVPLDLGCGDAARKGPGGDFLSDLGIDMSDVDGLRDVNGCTLSLACGDYTYEVFDACNNNSCWGAFTVEDKIAPTIIPPAPVTLNCTQSTDPGVDCPGSISASAAAVLPITWVANADVNGTGTADLANFCVPVGALPPGAIVTDINVDMQISHDWVGDLEIELTAPNGATVTLIDNMCGNDSHLDATFSDSGMPIACSGFDVGAAPCGQLAADGNAAVTGMVAPQLGTLAALTTGAISGDWCFDIDDTFTGLFGGCIESIELNIDYNVPAAAPAMLADVKYVDDLGNTVDPETPGATRVACDDELIFVDDFNDGDCGVSTIERTWIATDDKGNSSTSVQLITVEQIGAADVGIDWFWPDNDVVNSCVNESGEPGIRLTCGVDTSPMGVYEYHRDAYIACFPPASPDVADDPEFLANVSRFAVTKAFPYILAKDGGAMSFIDNNCNLIFDFNDKTLPACEIGCDGNEKILRDWTVLDWCSSESLTFRQIIHATDNEAPVVDMETAAGVQSSTSITVSVDPWGCVSTFALPSPEHLTDNCATDITYTYSGPIAPVFDNGVWFVSGAPIGTHVFTVTAVDCCGNEGTGTVQVTVIDSSPPIPVVTRDLVVGLTFSPTNPTGGAAKLFATQVDNGSFDGCGPVKTVIRRIDERDEDTECTNNLGSNGNHNNNNTFNDFNRNPPFSLFDTDGGEFVTFCCEDLFFGDGGDSDGDGVNDYVNIPVELGVWDDANMDGVPGTPGDNFAVTWANVRLESKITPILTCPPNAAVECFEDETSNFILDTQLGRATAVSNCGVLDVEFTDVCGYNQNAAGPDGILGTDDDDTDFDDTFFMGSVFPPEPNVPETFNKGCHFGPIVRTWSIPGTDISCQQIVIVRDPEVFFNGSYHPTDMDGNYTDDDENPTVTYPFEGNEVDSDDNGFYDFTEVEVGCLDDLGDLLEQTSWVTEHCSLITASVDSDTLEFEGDACRKIISEVCIIDWCQFEPNGDELIDDATGDVTADAPGKWCWTIIGKLLDTDAPSVTAANATFPAQPGSGGSGGEPTALNCVGTAAMTAVGNDMGACPSEWLKWVVLVDINNDWTFDWEWSSFILEDTPASTCGADSNGNGIPDFRVGTCGADNANDFATSPGDEYTIFIPQQILADCGDTQHRVEWTVFDGCGNIASTTSYFTVEDQKAPTPFCVNLSTALMDIPPTGGDAMVELWAIDFDRGSFDNCTADGDLRFSFVDDLTTIDDGGTFDPDSRSSFIRFTCEDLAGGNPALLTLPVYVWDGCGNRDFCLVNVRLVDNNEACPGVTGTGSLIAGEVRTEAGEMIENVSVDNSLMPNTNMGTELTDATGIYIFNENQEGLDYELTAEKNDDHGNGINTIDLILIQQHILGLRPLESAYQLIAADINNDGRVNSTDLVELRKLILGIYTEFPQNSSWRFVDADATLDINNPWNFDEIVEVYGLSSDMLHEDFIGVKIGDINGSATANAVTGSTEFKSGGIVNLEVPSVQVEAGQTFDVAVKASITDLYGYQFTLATPGLELVGVTAGDANVTEANFGVFNEAITTSWNTTQGINTSDKLFTMTFKSSVSGNAADIMRVTSGITSAEAYVGSDLDIVDIAVDNTVSTNDYALYANEPNPFSTKTVIGFDLPQDANATLTVYDVTGQVIANRKGAFTKGYNTIELSKSDLGVSGVLHYTLSSGDFTATKKMIIIE